jgi:signal transduction histidine kinase
MEQKNILKSLIDISGFTNYVENPDLILSLIVEECVLATRAQWGVILTYDSHLGLDSFAISRNIGDEDKSCLVDLFDDKVRRVIEKSGKTEALNDDLWKAPGVRKTFFDCAGKGCKDIMLHPIARKDAFIGLIIIFNKKIEKKSFDAQDDIALDVICQEISIVLENLRLFKSKIQNERMAAVGQTMAGISHYVKNVLQGISAGSYLLNTGIEHKDISSVQKAWTVVDKNTKRISDLVMDMLYYSKEREAEKQRIDPAVLIKDVTELLKSRLDEKKIELKISMKHMPRAILADEKGMHRSILNLVINSIEACDKPDSAIELSAYGDKIGGSMKMVIADNGKGMDRQTCEKVFQPFFTSKKQGTGLGLAITHKVIEEHGGTIKASSEPGKGTRFEITLPSAD